MSAWSGEGHAGQRNRYPEALASHLKTGPNESRSISNVFRAVWYGGPGVDLFAGGSIAAVRHRTTQARVPNTPIKRSNQSDPSEYPA